MKDLNRPNPISQNSSRLPDEPPELRKPFVDWSHYDLYDRSEPVKIAMDRLIPFYTRVLGPVDAGARADAKVAEPAD